LLERFWRLLSFLFFCVLRGTGLFPNGDAGLIGCTCGRRLDAIEETEVFFASMREKSGRSSAKELDTILDNIALADQWH